MKDFLLRIWNFNSQGWRSTFYPFGKKVTVSWVPVGLVFIAWGVIVYLVWFR